MELKTNMSNKLAPVIMQVIGGIILIGALFSGPDFTWFLVGLFLVIWGGIPLQPPGKNR